MIFRASVRTIAVIQMNGLYDSKIPMSPPGRDPSDVLAWLLGAVAFAEGFEFQKYYREAGFNLESSGGNANHPENVSLIKATAEEAANAYLSGSIKPVKNKNALDDEVRKITARDWFKKADDRTMFLSVVTSFFFDMTRTRKKDMSMEKMDMLVEKDEQKEAWEICEGTGLYPSLQLFPVAVALVKHGDKIERKFF